MIRILFALLLVVQLSAAPAADRVFLSVANYKGNWYSGYLDFDMGSFHYVFFESQRDPLNDPVVLWLNGGPGCSSLIGMFYENGPFVFETNTTNLKLNPYSWNMKANVLYLETPGGVGFSTGKRNSTYTDGTIADDNLAAILAFFTKFSEYKPAEFYITGESYAGIYGPWLAYKIVQYNKLPSSKATAINLKGIMINNACTDPRECYEPKDDSMSIYQYEFLFKHGYIVDQDYADLTGACKLSYGSDACANIRKIVDKKFDATKTSILNIYLPCYGPLTSSNSADQLNSTSDKPAFRKKYRQSGRYSIILGDEMSCDDSQGIMTYLNALNVQSAMHVKFMKYEECSNDVGDKYVMFANASYWIYPKLMEAGLRVWVVSGDVDADVPITGTINWIMRFKTDYHLAVVEPWREWWTTGLHRHEDQVAGMVWKLKGFLFASVKGAGHMVPRDKRLEGQTLVNCLISGADLPKQRP